MSMYRPYSNVCFNNCYDFIMKSKAEKEVWKLSTSLTFDDEEEMRWELDRISDLARDIMNAEYDLCEMEMDALYNAEEYDNILNGNAFRKGRNRKAKQNGKRNADKAKRLHKSDRRHGKIVPQSDKKYMDSLSGTFYRWDEKRKTFDSHKKPVVHKRRKTFRDRLVSAMDAREQDYILSPDPIEELWNAYWLYRDAECRLNHKADEPLFMHRTQGAYEEAIKEWEKLTEEEYNAFLKVSGLLYSLGLNWNYFES